MDITVSVGKPEQCACSLLLIGCYEDGLSETSKVIDGPLEGLLQKLYERGELSGKLNKTKLIYTLGKILAECVLVVGLGNKHELTAEKIRQAGGSAIQAARAAGMTKITSALLPLGDLLDGLVFHLEGMLLANYSFSKYQNKGEQQKLVEEVDFLLPQELSTGTAERKIAETLIICESTLYARDLVSQPANVATPPYLAEEALNVANSFGMTCQVLEREELDTLGMNALLAVAKGSQQPPKFIVLEHLPQPGTPPVVLIGKGVTFDSGGISLKPREGMEKMKNDMAGAAAVLGALRATAALKLPVNVIGLIPAVENLPGGNAYKPGDVITSFAGLTIEIVNTDAEGRLILCDALHYAKRYEPAAVIDVATLTGACVVALGTNATGMMGNDAALVSSVGRAATATGERVWELPLWEEYGDLMKSDIADLKNAGGPNAGTISAAWFLQQFVGGMPWVHLDIAGTVWEEKGRPYQPKGATGVGVRLLLEYLRADRV